MTITRTIQMLLDTVREELRAATIRRRQRLALNDLLGMNAARLDDLGLNRHDVIEAIAAADRTETNLDARRESKVARRLAAGVR